MHLIPLLRGPWPDPLALTTGLPVRLATACAVVAMIWAMVAWAW